MLRHSQGLPSGIPMMPHFMPLPSIQFLSPDKPFKRFTAMNRPRNDRNEMQQLQIFA